MRVISEMRLRDFEFWGGAKDFAAKLTSGELDAVEFEFEDEYPEGMTETDINDTFWFSRDSICALLGETEEDIWNREE